jgi:hypothetical protein
LISSTYVKSLLCPNVNLNSFKNELSTYLVELFLQGSDDLSMGDNIDIFQCVYELIENRYLIMEHDLAKDPASPKLLGI